MILQFNSSAPSYPFFSYNNYTTNGLSNFDVYTYSYVHPATETKSSYKDVPSNKNPDFDYCTKIGGYDLRLGYIGNTPRQLGALINYDISDIFVIGVKGIYTNGNSTGNFLMETQMPTVYISNTATPGLCNVKVGGSTIGQYTFSVNLLNRIEVEVTKSADTVSVYCNNVLVGTKTSAGVSGLSGIETGWGRYNYDNVITPIQCSYVLNDVGSAPFNARLGEWDSVELEPISSTDDGNWTNTDATLYESITGINSSNNIKYNSDTRNNSTKATCTITYKNVPSNYKIGALAGITASMPVSTGVAVIESTLYINSVEEDSEVNIQNANAIHEGERYRALGYNNSDASDITSIKIKYRTDTAIEVNKD